MSVAPFSLVVRDALGRIKRVTPLQFIPERNFPKLTNAVLRKRGEAI